MAQLLSVMLALSPSLMVDSRDVLGLGEVKHVMAGEEYNVRQQLSQVRAFQCTNVHQVHPPLNVNTFEIFQGVREPKSNGLCSKVPANKYKNCLPQGEDTRSFYDYTSEDIEKMTNVSFSEPEYQGKVLMVVNLASF